MNASADCTCRVSWTARHSKLARENRPFFFLALGSSPCSKAAATNSPRREDCLRVMCVAHAKLMRYSLLQLAVVCCCRKNHNCLQSYSPAQHSQTRPGSAPCTVRLDPASKCCSPLLAASAPAGIPKRVWRCRQTGQLLGRHHAWLIMPPHKECACVLFQACNPKTSLEEPCTVLEASAPV